MPPAKEVISIRIDKDVLSFFRSTGPGYQTRMNAVLRAFVEHEAARQGAKKASRVRAAFAGKASSTKKATPRKRTSGAVSGKVSKSVSKSGPKKVAHQ
jgi:BrnA antitoxin of type II toxin-antitoxin system